MLIIHKIEQTHFSPAESLVIQYILDNSDKVKEMTMSSIAKETYTSPPLLARIAKKLGYSGWNTFKDAYLEELNYLYASSEIDASIPFVVSDNFMTISNHISQLQIETIHDTMDLLKHDDLYKAISIIRKSAEIDMYGVSGNILLAQGFAHKMFYLHKHVNICQLPGDAKLQAAMSDKNHCAILISYSGQTEFILQVCKMLKSKHVPMIAITSIADNELSKFADVTLRISSREMLHTKIANFSTVQSVNLILDILYGCIFSLNYQKNLDYRISIAKQVDDRISGFEYIDED